jgi:pimeloyl-ACP methyl ester carboxylesterase
MTATASDRMIVAGIELEVLRRGTGRPIVVLHGMQTIPKQSQFVDHLARMGAVLAPSSPGFGNSARPKDFDTIYDLVHLHRALIDSIGDGPVVLIGLSFGGWLAAEIAATSPARLDRLVLIDPLGIRISDRETPDILDVFNRSPSEVRRAAWHDPDRFDPDFDAMDDDELVVYARNRDALCLYGWHPYLHNPQLPRWLNRIDVPTLLLWGSSDRIVSPDYGHAYAALIPGAKFELIAAAGHHPEIEQPDLVVSHITRFLDGAL